MRASRTVARSGSPGSSVEAPSIDDMDHAWPEDPETTEHRIRGTVESVIRPHEHPVVSLHWVERFPVDAPSYEDLEVRVEVLDGEEGFSTSVWPHAAMTWEQALDGFALALENWIYDSRFAGGEHRIPQVSGALDA